MRNKLSEDQETVASLVRMPKDLHAWVKKEAARVADERGEARGAYGFAAYIRESIENRRKRANR